MDAKQAHFVGYFSLIPSRVRDDDSLSATAKLFFGDIASMAQSDGYCYASNAYFSERFGLTERTVTRTIKQLADRGHVKLRICRSNTGQITGRRIYPLFDPTVPEEDGEETTCNAPKDSGENDTLSHPTKMSTRVDKNVLEYPTKMSTGLIRKSNLIQDNIPPISPKPKKRGKTTDDTAAREQLRQWADSLFGGAEAEALKERLMQFCDVRLEKRDPLPAGTSLKAKTNKLRRLSAGRLEIMLEILDKTICNGWLDFYPLKDDVARGFEPESVLREPKALPKSGSYGEDGYKWL